MTAPRMPSAGRGPRHSQPLPPFRARPAPAGKTSKPAAAFAPQLMLMLTEPGTAAHPTVEATALARINAANLISRLRGLAGWQTYLAVTPDTAVWSRAPALAQGPLRIAQGRGDPGQRMQRVLERANPGPVLFIEGNAAMVNPTVLRQAAARLGTHDAVFAIAPDGICWLAGFKRRPRVPKAFAGVSWPGANAHGDALKNLANCKVATITAPASRATPGRSVLLDADPRRRILPAAT